MSAATIEFVHIVVAAFPALAPMLKEHLEDNFGELLPHLFIADVARAAVAALTGVSAELSAPPLDRELLVRLLAFLEHQYVGGGTEVQELLAVSFLEHLPGSDEAGAEVREMLGPAMSDQLRVIR